MASPEFRPHPHRQLWDARYRDAYQPRSPSALLARWITQLPAGRALDVACGTGRNTLLLAMHGWHVLGVDISPVGLRIAQEAARQAHVAVDLVAVDLDQWRWPIEAFDLVCVFRFLDRTLPARLVAALRPGGVLIYETFTIDQCRYAGGPRDPALLLQPNELPTLFPRLAVLEHTEGVIEEDDRPRALAGLVGRKPA